MKLSKMTLLALSLILITACSTETPAPVNEEEFITTVKAVFVPTDGGATVTLVSRDLDGSGAEAPTNTVSGAFAQNKTYTGVVTFLNEATNPVGDITEEIKQDAEEHQVFYRTTGGMNKLEYSKDEDNYDANKNPIGLKTTLATTAAAKGNLIITLRHIPNKSAEGVKAGIIDNAGGTTDAEVTFDVEVL